MGGFNNFEHIGGIAETNSGVLNKAGLSRDQIIIGNEQKGHLIKDCVRKVD